jgi:hypothetical protein
MPDSTTASASVEVCGLSKTKPSAGPTKATANTS